MESHSGIDSFRFSREYNMKGQIINTIGATSSSAGKSFIAFEPPAST